MISTRRMIDESGVVEGGVYRTHHHQSASRELRDDREVLEVRFCDSGHYGLVWVYFRRVDRSGRPVPAWRRRYVSMNTFVNWADEQVR